MNEGDEVFLVVYPNYGGECLGTHIRFVESEEEGNRFLNDVQRRDEGHLILIKGHVIKETSAPTWMSE